MNPRPYQIGIILAIALDAGAVFVDQYGAHKLAFAMFAVAAVLSATATLALLMGVKR